MADQGPSTFVAGWYPDPDLVDTPVYNTNLRTGIQYKFSEGAWTKSFEGEYRKGYWRLIF